MADIESPLAPNLKAYDIDIKEHYDKVALSHKESPSSTMEDLIIRRKETDFIINIINEYSKTQNVEPISILEVGCGNGYTLSMLASQFSHFTYEGIEFNDSLRSLANERLNQHNIKVNKGDIRDLSTLSTKKFDILVCQRVIINLLDSADQKQALQNLITLVKKGGLLVFIESFNSGLNNLNDAREEFALKRIPPAHHNLYLEDDFFVHPNLKPFALFKANLLSTHYFVSRVLHELALITNSSPFTRNSHFVSFLSEALPESVGNYSPLQFLSFIKL